MKLFIISILSLIVVCFSSCSDKEIDTEKPNIDISIADAFPKNCDTIYFGEEFSIKLLLTDNIELGSFSIDIHNNFDHHSHTTEVNPCDLDPIKSPINPFSFIQDFEIEDGLKEYTTNIVLNFDKANSNGNFDKGDYHFFINLSDKEGWTSQKGLSIKIL